MTNKPNSVQKEWAFFVLQNAIVKQILTPYENLDCLAVVYDAGLGQWSWNELAPDHILAHTTS